MRNSLSSNTQPQTSSVIRAPLSVIRYQYDNHLGSACLEVATSCLRPPFSFSPSSFPQCSVFRAPYSDSGMRYDALYRLVRAEGRELTNLTAPSHDDFPDNIPCPNPAGNAMQNYTHNYVYDELGNMLSDAWKTNDYASANNYLLGHDGLTNQYTYDAHGNMLTMPHLSGMEWDYLDQLHSATNGTFTSYYSYDAQGNRTRKVVEKGNIREERYYFNGYEVYRKYTNNTLDFERTTLNISDDEKVFARIEQKTNENEIVRYQYDNHLGSACLELDESGAIISYEEYHPFGTTSYRSGHSDTEVSQKRYKYCGKERDEESGLYYYGMRYYAPWLCRFVSVDPLQFEYPHYTPYQYAGNKPVTYIDLDGAEEVSPQEKEKGEIAFIDSYSGHYLGSFVSDTIEGYSVRSIANGDFYALQKNNFEELYNIISIEKSSEEVTVDYEQIINTFETILEKKTKMVNGNSEEIERGLLLVFDKDLGSIYAIEINDRDSTGTRIRTQFLQGTYISTVQGNPGKVILAQFHTHPPSSIGEFMEQTRNIIGIQYFRDAGVSEADANMASETRSPVYAIAKYETQGEEGNVFRVGPNKEGESSKEVITNIKFIMTNQFHLIKDVFKSRTKKIY